MYIVIVNGHTVSRHDSMSEAMRIVNKLFDRGVQAALAYTDGITWKMETY